jgi:hypothetical protein
MVMWSCSDALGSRIRIERPGCAPRALMALVHTACATTTRGYGWVGHARPESVAAESLTWGFCWGVTSVKWWVLVRQIELQAGHVKPHARTWEISCPCGPFRVEKAQKTIGGSEFGPSHQRRHSFLAMCTQPSHGPQIKEGVHLLCERPFSHSKWTPTLIFPPTNFFGVKGEKLLKNIFAPHKKPSQMGLTWLLCAFGPSALIQNISLGPAHFHWSKMILIKWDQKPSTAFFFF